MAPEQLAKGHWHNATADWYQLGVTVVELMKGERPYTQLNTAFIEKLSALNPNIGTTTENANIEQIKVPGSSPDCASPTGKAIVGRMLSFAWWKRIGLKDDENEIKTDPWFEGFDWTGYQARTITPPFMPNTQQANCEGSASEMADMFEEESSNGAEAPPDDKQAQFDAYSWNTDLTGNTRRRSSLKAVKSFIRYVPHSSLRPCHSWRI